MEPTRVRRTESHFEAAGNRVLFRRAWLSDRTERVLLVAHGLGEHSGRYDNFGAWMAERGSSVHAFDHQGHGRSSGKRCHIRRFRHLLDDLEVVLSSVQQDHPGIPIFLVGHSMGSLIVVDFLRDRQPSISGAVLSGAPLALPAGLSAARRVVAGLLRHLAPGISVETGIDPEALCTDSSVVKAYTDDPLVVRRMTLALRGELFGAIKRASSGAPEIRVPTLLLHGEDDRVCAPDASTRFRQRMTVDGAVKLYSGMRHEIFNEPHQHTVFEDVLAWVTHRANLDAVA